MFNKKKLFLRIYILVLLCLSSSVFGQKCKTKEESTMKDSLKCQLDKQFLEKEIKSSIGTKEVVSEVLSQKSPDVLFIGENHSNTALEKLYPKLINDITTYDEQFNCLILERAPSINKEINQIIKSDKLNNSTLPSHILVREEYKDPIDGKMTSVSNFEMSTKLLLKVKEKKLQVFGINHRSDTDSVARDRMFYINFLKVYEGANSCKKFIVILGKVHVNAVLYKPNKGLAAPISLALDQYNDSVKDNDKIKYAKINIISLSNQSHLSKTAYMENRQGEFSFDKCGGPIKKQLKTVGFTSMTKDYDYRYINDYGVEESFSDYDAHIYPGKDSD